MKKLTAKLKEYDRALTVKKRLSLSNLIMFLMPLGVTAVMALACVAAACFALMHSYLPSLGISTDELHEMGEQYEDALRSFELIVLGLIVLLLVVIVYLSLYKPILLNSLFPA